MSSTNRKNSQQRQVSDYYITPIDEINKFLPRLWDDYIGQQSLVSILDPCAGGDTNHEPAYPTALGVTPYTYNIASLDTIDIREDSKADVIGDFLEMDIEKKYDLIISNPPFSHALEFIQKCISLLEDDGLVAMLLRLNFLGSKERNEWLLDNMPIGIYVHGKRMSFGLNKDGKRGTDSIEYAHFVWSKEPNPDGSILTLLPY